MLPAIYRVAQEPDAIGVAMDKSFQLVGIDFEAVLLPKLLPLAAIVSKDQDLVAHLINGKQEFGGC